MVFGISESTIFDYFVIASLIGTAYMSYRLILEIRASRNLVRNSQRISTHSPSNYPIIQTQLIAVPMVTGFLRPQIVIPECLLEKLSEEQIEVLIAHEEAHLSRFDLWVLLLQRVLACLVWWNLVVHYFNRESAAYREMICDDIAAREIGSYKSYSIALLDIALSIGEQDSTQGFNLQLVYQSNILG